MFERHPSEAQLRANRENAKKSTGPKTPEGKRTSSMNGIRHNLTGQVLIETGADYDARTEFVDRYTMELQPVGFIEIDLVHAIAETAWRRNRIRSHENNFLSLRLATGDRYQDTGHAEVSAALIQAGTVFERTKDLANLALYEQHLTNLFHKNMKALHELQRVRRIQTAVKPLAAKATAGNATTFPEIGFAFSNEKAPAKSEPSPARTPTQDAS